MCFWLAISRADCHKSRWERTDGRSLHRADARVLFCVVLLLLLLIPHKVIKVTLTRWQKKEKKSEVKKWGKRSDKNDTSREMQSRRSTGWVFYEVHVKVPLGIVPVNLSAHLPRKTSLAVFQTFHCLLFQNKMICLNLLFKALSEHVTWNLEWKKNEWNIQRLVLWKTTLFTSWVSEGMLHSGSLHL